MSFIIYYGSSLLIGTLVTLSAWIITGIISISIGLTLGIASSQYLAIPAARPLIRVYTFIAKGVPAYVHILIAYFALPALLGINIPGFIAASIALIFCSSGYTTEIIRAGINSIPRGQWDAAVVLGYSLSATLSRIILPQTVRTIAPALLGECEQLLKSTSLFATIGITELTRAGMNIISRELNPIPVYFTIACIYLLISAVLQFFMILIEKKTIPWLK